MPDRDRPAKRGPNQVQTNIASDVAVVTPWYPTGQRPFRGAFVQAMVEATAPEYRRVTVYHTDEWGHRLPAETTAAIDEAYRALLPHGVHRRPTVGGADLVHLPVVMPVTPDYAEISRNHTEALRSSIGNVPLDAPVVHAHVGLPGGWAALHNARPDARVFVTEHATFLNLVLEQPEARAMYDELLHRCAGFFAVGDAVRKPLVEAFPHHADKIGFIPNPIAFDQPRATPVTALHRWLFVGGLLPRKGVSWLLEAFAKCRAEEPDLSLTFVGEGQLRKDLTRRAAELGVTEAVTFAGALPPDEALRMMREHDLLVHPSRFETFGMTIVEAIAAGTPVLVTRCGGPEETLAGLEQAAGELIPVEENAESIVDGYRRLRDRFPHGLDLPRAQRELADKYSYPAVARSHREAWFGGAGAGASTTTGWDARTDG
ncbi:glycosyltransferase family 4 protein [Plantactinospora endophytica]|uniref:glycosyltransferase family 4 protein n=1 Tax=Plantactinospora endophytica TaxID=673535 RepID=UPI001EF29CD3|nr:glycosyltransferase family 4 protein [Plantactinospora endophytica]